jgi:hypothetical protein
VTGVFFYSSISEVIQMNIENLKLARQGFIDNYDRIAPNFDLKYFRRDKYGEPCGFESKTDCGEVGCALGWCPLLGVPELEPIEDDYFVNTRGLDFSGYSERVFGLDDHGWDFLFGVIWEHKSFKKPKNTLDDFIARLDYFIENDGDIQNAY